MHAASPDMQAGCGATFARIACDRQPRAQRV